MTIADFKLPRRLRRTVGAVARVICPRELDAHGLAEHVIDSVEMQLRAMPGGFRAAMVAGLAALEAGAVLRYGKVFSDLDPARAERWFHGLWASPLGPFRQLAKALKALVALSFYQAPAIRAQMEYHPDRWIAEAGKRRLEQWGLEIQKHEEELLAPNPLLTIRKTRHA